MAVVFQTLANGTGGTALASGATDVGSFGAVLDFGGNGGVVEYTGGGELWTRGATSVVQVFALTAGYTVPTGSATTGLRVRAGSLGGGAHQVSLWVRNNAPGDAYNYGISQNGIFLDKWLGNSFDATLYVSTSGIVAGNEYDVQLDVYTSGRLVLRVNGATVYDVVDGSPVVPDGTTDFLFWAHDGTATTRSRLSECVVYDSLFVVPPLASPVQTRSRRFRGHPFRTLTYRGNGVAPAGGSGDAAGSVVFTGTAAGTLRVQGAATGAAVFTGAATGALRNEGDATGAVVFGGSATGEQNASNSGDATGVALFTGSATGVLRNDGAATGSALFTGSAAGTLLVQGGATGALQLTGVATGRLAVQGAASGVAVFTGAAAGAQEPPGAGGTAVGVVVFTGAASGALRLAGAASGVVVFGGAAGGVDPDLGGGASSGRMRRRGVRTPYQFVQ